MLYRFLSTLSLLLFALCGHSQAAPTPEKVQVPQEIDHQPVELELNEDEGFIVLYLSVGAVGTYRLDIVDPHGNVIGTRKISSRALKVPQEILKIQSSSLQMFGTYTFVVSDDRGQQVGTIGHSTVSAKMREKARKG